jgi:ABC-2 type transport system permease protein
MHTYLRLAEIAFQKQLQYRMANFCGIAVNSFFLAIRIYVLIAFYQGKEVVGGFDLQMAIVYSGVTEAIMMMCGVMSMEGSISQLIKSGDVVSRLMKPADFFLMQMAEQLGRAAYYFIFRAIPLMAVLFIVFQPGYHPSADVIGMTLLSLTVSVLTCYCLGFIANISAFWVLDAQGVINFMFAVTWMFGGFIIPLDYMPDFMLAVMWWSPFAGTGYTPMAIAVGRLTGDEMWWALIRQVAWAVVLIFVCRRLFRHGVRKLVVQGG